VGFLCGCCKRCLLLLAGWCEGFCGVQVSEALAAFKLKFSCPSLACWVGEVSTQYLISIRCISRLFGCMSVGFIARGGGGLAAPSANLSRATHLALLADLV
jgi:hypothetical protein